MPTGRLSQNLSIGGVTITASINRTADNPAAWEVTLPAGKVVTAWVKTDANTAACTLPGGHGYSNGNFDVYWGDGMVRYGVPGTISTNALSLDGGAGDDFPASATSGVVVTRQVQVNASIDGDAVSLAGVKLKMASSSATNPGHIQFHDAAADTIAALDLVANVPRIFDVTGGSTNVFTGDPITYAMASNGSSTADATLQLCVLQDSTP